MTTDESAHWRNEAAHWREQAEHWRKESEAWREAFMSATRPDPDAPDEESPSDRKTVSIASVQRR